MSTGPQFPIRPERQMGLSTLQSQLGLTAALCKAAIEAWRLQRLGPRVCEVDRERIQAIADRLTASLAQAGVVIEDHTDQAYVEGLSVEVLTIEVRTDFAPGEHRIVETVKPSVYIAGQLVAPGQVILGRGANQDERGTNGPRDD